MAGIVPRADPLPSRTVRAAPLIFLVLWSGGYAAAKVGLPYTGPMTLLALRYAIALVLLAPVLLWIKEPEWPRTRSAWMHVLIVGFGIQVAYFGCSYIAFDLGMSAGGVALITCMQPILVALFAPMLADEQVTSARWIGLVLGLSGAVIVIAARSSIEAESALGVVAACGALVSMSGVTLYEKRYGGGTHPITANVIQFALGVVVLVPVAILLEGFVFDVTARSVAALGYLSIGNSLIAITLLLAMIRRGEASRVSALLFLVPPGAALIAWIVIGERMPLLAWPGMALAAAGVYIATRRAVPQSA
jgi:drug/metabolite transporter (DMT)-like permease